MGNTAFRKRLKQEAKRASALNHPNIVTIHEFGEHNGVEFIVMEFVAGKTLSELIPQHGLSVALAIHYALQIADVLATAHSGGILHRDLKPRNIMVTGEGRVKVLDFGLATVLTSSSTPPNESRETESFGTRIYMAPEQLRKSGSEPDPRSEVFSFGLILHEMLRSGHPFGAGTREDILDGILNREPASLPSSIPDALVAFVTRCLHKSPDQRFASAQDLLDALKMWHSTNSREIPVHPRRVRRAPSAELAEVRGALANVTYESLSRSRKALQELERILGHGVPAAVRNAVTSNLKEVIVTLERDTNGVSGTIREIRKRVLDVLKMSADGSLNRCFEVNALEHLDLYGMDFSSTDLEGRSFHDCFLVEANFGLSCLKRTLFSSACVRNADFCKADLTEADLTDADWFNALNLTEGQLRVARRETVMTCPPNVPAMHRFLKARYGFSFESWSTHVQMQLKTAWAEYLGPGGLREIVSGWLNT